MLAVVARLSGTGRVAILAALLSTAALAQAPTAPPETLALLVGIAEYSGVPDWPAPGTLKGPVNDVDRAERLLVERFHFAPESIVKLVNEAATHEAIVTTFHEHLIRRAGPDTKVVFWFSGHGSRVPDGSGKDPAPRGDIPMDDTLVAYDSRAVDPFGSYDLTDDELHSLLAALPARDVLVVTDCCHSGGLVRGADDTAIRHVVDGTAPGDRGRMAWWPPRVPFLDDDRDGGLSHVVHLAACGSLQVAGEHKTAAGWYGTFTWFLAQTLGDIEPEASWREVAFRTRARVAGEGSQPGQLVELTGDGGRAVFGGCGRAVPPGYQVDRFGVRGLAIGAGRIHGLTTGAELRLVGLDGEERGRAVVDKVRASSCDAEWQGKGPAPKEALRAVPLTPGESTPLRVTLAEGVDGDLLAGSAVATVTPPAEAEYRLARGVGGFVLTDLAGKVLRHVPRDRAGAQLALFREHCFRSLWHGIAEPGRFRVRVAVEPASAAEVERLGIPPARLVRDAAVVGAAVLDPKDRRTGSLVTIVVQNQSDYDLHVALLAVSASREVNVVWGLNRNNVVAAKKSFAKTAWVGLPPHWPKDEVMIDRFIAVATPRFADFRPFESGVELTAAVRGSADDEAALPPFLRQALGGRRTRGDTDPPAWGIGFLDLQVVSRELFDKVR